MIHCVRRHFPTLCVAVGALSLALLSVPVSYGQDVKKPESGIELVGRSDKEPPLYYWYVDDAKTKKRIASVYQRWGFTAVPPGDYVVVVRQDDSEVPYATVQVAKDKVSRVEVRSGIEVVGRSEKEPPLYYWHADDAKTKKRIASGYQRWGFTPLPPGDYVVVVRQDDSEVPYATVQVAKDKVSRVEVRSGIEVVGRSAKEPPLYYWYVDDAKTKKRITEVYQRWGFTPVPAGEYIIVVRQNDSHVPYATVQVAQDKVTKVAVSSGIAVTGRSAKEPPLYYWYVDDAKTKKRIAEVYQRWGFTPAPPGEYVVVTRKDDTEIPYATVQVKKDQVAEISLGAGIEVTGRSAKEPPLQYWHVDDAKTKKRVESVYQRWGFLAVPPGEYTVSVEPQEYGLALPWATLKVVPGKVSAVNVDSGIELAGVSDKDPPLEYWYVFDANSKAKDKKPVAQAYKRWGFTPLPAGAYTIHSTPRSIAWAEAKVAEGQVAKVRLPDLAERLVRVTGAGRKTEKQRDPEAYRKLEEEVEKAIRRGGAWLKKQEKFAAPDLDDYYLTIGILALLHAGEFERDPALADRCLDYLQRRPLNIGKYSTYATALTAMALRDLDPFRYSKRVHECAQWLVENQGSGRVHKVWGYGYDVPGIGETKKVAPPPPAKGASLEVVRKGLIAAPEEYWDNSCTQFVVLGLHSSVHAGIKLPRDVWERVEKHFHGAQGAEGGWGYFNDGGTGSMTCAGLASLAIARHHLGKAKAALDPAMVRGLEWLAGLFTVEQNPHQDSDHYYYLYGLERVGVLANTEFLGDHEWYPVGARYLLKQQNADGSWTSKTGEPTGSYAAYLDTCYAILFLRRATLPSDPPKPSFLRVAYDKPVLPPPLLPAVDLLLDSSGSMKEKVEGETKQLIARKVMDKVLADLPDRFQVGLRVFGHVGFWDWRTKGFPPDNDPRWNTDSELMITIGPLGDKDRRKLIKQWIDFLEPAGATPLVHSLLQARNDFAGSTGPRLVVLVSDGIDTCGGKLEDVAKAYQGSGIDVVIHVVGFGVDPKERKQLEGLAKIGKGTYFNAADAAQLSEGLQRAMASIRFIIQDSGRQKIIAQGVTNGPDVLLKPGTYWVSIPDARVDPVQVQIASGQELQLRVDDTGKLVVPVKGASAAP